MIEHTLYRHFDAQGRLLYVGITVDPGRRWKQHQADKPWWAEVAQTTYEQHPDRASVLAAEREAILREEPLHNVVHNRRAPTGRVEATPVQTRTAPVQAGDWIAVALSDGRCPVGEVAALDETWVSLRLISWASGYPTHKVEVARWSDVVQIRAAYVEDATKESCGMVLETKHLTDLQAMWRRAHGGARGEDDR